MSRFPGGCSVADRGAVAPRIGPAYQDAAARVEGDAVGVAGQLVPRFPPIDRVAPAGQLRDGGLREAALQVELLRASPIANRPASQRGASTACWMSSPKSISAVYT